jgi:hypothetical protein
VQLVAAAGSVAIAMAALEPVMTMLHFNSGWFFRRDRSESGGVLHILDAKLTCRRAAASLVVVGLLASGAVAQITEPLLPAPAPLSGPQAPAAPGQPTYPGQTVTQRPRPEYQVIGSRVGDFFWFPRAELYESYNSNIFATPRPTYDLITALQPGFDLLSSFPRNALNLRGGSTLQFYADHPAQNTQDGVLNVDGRLDVTAGSSIYGNAQVAHQHIAYGSPNSPGGVAQPITYNDYIARAGYTQGGRRFSYQVDLGVESAQYNAVPLVGGGILPQSSQDTTISEAALRANYEIIPDYIGYIRATGDLYDYWRTVPGGVRFNSTVYRVDLGLQILPRHIVYGEIYAGYLIQNFALSSLGTSSSPDAGGRLIWDITRLTTLTLTGLRTFVTSNPSIGTTGAGYLTSIFTVTADHELLRNLLLNVSASYENDSFHGFGRTDNVFNAGAGFRYLVTRNLFLGGTYSYLQRSSSLSGASYTQNILLLRLGTHF